MTDRDLRRKREWIAREGVTESQSSLARNDPVAWLLGRKRTVERRPRWFDHGTAWRREGKPYVVIGQPYELFGADLEELNNIEDNEDLHIAVLSHPSWHYPGQVLSVFVSIRDEFS